MRRTCAELCSWGHMREVVSLPGVLHIHALRLEQIGEIREGVRVDRIVSLAEAVIQHQLVVCLLPVLHSSGEGVTDCTQAGLVWRT